MGLHRKLALIMATAALSWSVSLWAQQSPPAKPSPGAPAQQQPAARQGTAYYERYEASQRQRLRRETCGRDEDTVAQYCVKKCQKGYILVGGNTLPRQCRGEKALPPGQLPQPYARQPAQKPAPPPPSRKGAPGA